MRSVRLPCVKRPISLVEIEGIVDDIEDALARVGRDEIESKLIGEMAMERLKTRDHVAYVRFASVYRNFQDIDEFYEELRELDLRRAREAQKESQAELPL